MSEDIVRLTADLYAFVIDSESLTKRAREELNTSKFRAAAEDLHARCAQLKTDTQSRLSEQVTAVRENLDQMLEELRKQKPSKGSLKKSWASLGVSYENLVVQMQKASVKIPRGIQINHFKPRNYSRNFFHLFNSLWGVALYEFVLDRTGMLWVSGGILVLAIAIEVSRRLSPAINKEFCERIFGAISRPHETHNITSATWYSLALFLGVWLLPQHAIEAGTIVLGVADPAASIVGKAWGKTKIYRDKSLEGSLGFFFAAVATLVVFFAVINAGYSALAIGITAVSVAAFTTLAELFAGKIEDNFSIPVVGGIVAAVCLSLTAGL
jgi:dolichol kinase